MSYLGGKTCTRSPLRTSGSAINLRRCSERRIKSRILNGLLLPLPNWLRIPTQTGHPFRFKLDTDSENNWTVIPIETGHPIRK